MYLTRARTFSEIKQTNFFLILDRGGSKPLTKVSKFFFSAMSFLTQARCKTKPKISKFYDFEKLWIEGEQTLRPNSKILKFFKTLSKRFTRGATL